jgi:CID domain
METCETELLDALKSLSTAKDKIFEISNIMLSHQSANSKEMVSLWLKEFQSLHEEKKKLAMLFVMNDTLIKSIRDSRGDEYLKEFPLVMNDIIHSLIEFKSEYLLEELRKIVMVWEKPGTLIYVLQYTSSLKSSIQDAINAIQDDRTGASVIQEFDITKKLTNIENKHESNLELAKRVESLTEKTLAWKKNEIISQLEDYKEKCEEELIERSNVLMELSEMLEREYQIYIAFPEKIEEIKNSLDVSVSNNTNILL